MGRLFGLKLYYLRTRQHLTQVDLVRRLQFASQAHVSNLEQNRFEPSLEVIVAVANLFAVQVEYLVREDLPVEAAEDASAQRHANDAPLTVQSFGVSLARLRAQGGLTQAQLAANLALSGHAHISYLESGRKLPSVELLLRVADHFGVTTDDLLTPSP